ncbi:MAG: c-type cytochrome [Thalassolituus sp.]
MSSYAENTSELLQRFRQAETDPAVAEALAQQGQERGSLCFACHGNAGHGNETYPRIAGQPYEFLEKTLLKFRAGDASRANSPMTAVVSNMKEEDLKAVASWVANMP